VTIVDPHEVPPDVMEAFLHAAPRSAMLVPAAWRAAVGAAITQWDKNRPAPEKPGRPAGHECHWRTAGVRHQTIIGIEQTHVLQVCDGCGDVRTTQLGGHWELSDLLKQQGKE